MTSIWPIIMLHPSWSLGNCHAAALRLTKAIHTEGRRGTFLHQQHHTLWLPDTLHPFLLLCMKITESCSCDHMGSPPFMGCHLLQGMPRAFALTTPGDLSFLWALGDPTPHLHTRGLFQNMQRTSLSLQQDASITVLSTSPLKLSPCIPFSTLWSPWRPQERSS